MTADYRYAGPDGELAADLPAGLGAAIGSEYCVHLLPGPGKLAEAVRISNRRGTPLLLMTPYFRDAELKKAMGLFRSIPVDEDVDVAVNDWGALLALRGLFPRMRLSIGRLLSGQKRCPRIGVSPYLTREGRLWHGEGIHSSAGARGYLFGKYGVSGYHLDSTPWGPDLSAWDREHGEGGAPACFLHGPHSIVTVSDACPWIGGKSSAALACCSRPCRKGVVLLREQSMGRDMVQRGKARFVLYGGSAGSGTPAAANRCFVYYDDVP